MQLRRILLNVYFLDEFLEDKTATITVRGRAIIAQIDVINWLIAITVFVSIIVSFLPFRLGWLTAESFFLEKSGLLFLMYTHYIFCFRILNESCDFFLRIFQKITNGITQVANSSI